MKANENYSVSEPTAWLRLAVNKRVEDVVAEIEASDVADDVDLILTVLVEPPEDPEGYADWDHKCDRCFSLVRPGDLFVTGQSSVRHEASGRVIVITYGLCEECGAKEISEDATPR